MSIYSCTENFKVLRNKNQENNESILMIQKDEDKWLEIIFFLYSFRLTELLQE